MKIKGHSSRSIRVMLVFSLLMAFCVINSNSQKLVQPILGHRNVEILKIDDFEFKTVLATFGTTPEAVLDVVFGSFNPTGKMPFTTPVSAKAVLENQSDVPGYLKPKGYALFKFGDGLSY